MDQKSSGRFDISDALGMRLFLLERLCEDGNGYAAWVAYRVCRLADREWPDWLTTYFDRSAAFLLDEYEREQDASRQIELGLGLGKPRTARAEADGNMLPRRHMQGLARELLPGLVDDFAADQGIPIQTAIKRLAPVLGYGGEHQWTRLRDAYKHASNRRSAQSD